MVMNVNAQLVCGTVMEDDGIVNLANQNVTMESFLGLEPYVLKVHFWDINDTDGTNPHPLSELTALNAVAQLNKNYNSFNIFFKYDGIDEFDSEYYQSHFDSGSFPDNSNIGPFMYNNNYFVQGAVNIYSLDRILFENPNGGDPIEAAGMMRWGSEYFKMILMRHDFIEPTNFDYSVLTHEVGHFFNLIHTFDCGPTDVESLCENVTRNVDDDDCYNADIGGDLIIDTNATPKGMLYDEYGCTYTPNGEVDSCGVAYNAGGLEPEVTNFMGYNKTCNNEFTPGQVAYMRWYIDYMADHPDGLYVIENYPVPILYKPYKGEYYLAGPSTSHNPPLYQYGFDYVFYDTSQAEVYNQPSNYEDTTFWYGDVVESFDTNYNTPIVHQNHTAFKILQVDANYPRICYNNYNKAPSDGTIIKFLDGVPNANVTITAQDSTQINNSNLIEELEPGLYNVKKNYEDGGTQETMIYKENN